MKKTYEKPEAEVVNFEIINNVMSDELNPDIPQISTNDGVDLD